MHHGITHAEQLSAEPLPGQKLRITLRSVDGRFRLVFPPTAVRVASPRNHSTFGKPFLCVVAPTNNRYFRLHASGCSFGLKPNASETRCPEGA